MLTVNDLLTYAKQLDTDENVKISLYFVTRHLKNKLTKNAKVMDKYDFKLVKAPIDSDVSQFFKKILAHQITTCASKDDVMIKNYTVIDDDIDNKIYAYALNNALSFAQVINDKIKSDKIPELQALKDIQSNLWAYCIKIQKDHEFTYSFRKISKGKVTTDEPQNVMQKLSALFDKTSKELQAFEGSIINFDDKIDCIYIQEQFYVFHKKGFEAIIGLEAEFTEAAQKTLLAIGQFELVDGLDILERAILHKPSLRKTLAHIAEKGNHTHFDAKEIQTMNDILLKYQGNKFKISEEGKIVLENERDGRNFLRLLNDCYKQGMITKKIYETESGNIVNPAS